MRSFATITEAQAYISQRVDVPVRESQVELREQVDFHAFSLAMGDGQFTNVYDISTLLAHAETGIHVHAKPTDVYNFASHQQIPAATISGGFFFLADEYRQMPRQAALNTAVHGGEIRSLPVVDRETLIVNQGIVSGQQVLALGELSIGSRTHSWAGSLTQHDAELRLFGNGNVTIHHATSAETGSRRVLEESTRFTPAIAEAGMIDIGLVHRHANHFVRTTASREGGLDIFAHDVVLRGREAILTAATDDVIFRSLGNLALDNHSLGAISVGPSLHTTDFDTHPINADRSLGDKPPFLATPMARTMLYQTADDRLHIRLFDGRPGSPVFPGVTPAEAFKLTEDEGEITWGYFLDPGQTAKLCIQAMGRRYSFGNAHYLQWPTVPGEPFTWVPYRGRPDASVITLQ